MRVLFVKQDHCSPAGLVGDGFSAAGWDISELVVVPGQRYRCPGVTATFPAAGDYDAVVFFGAPWAVYDTATIPWIGDEIDYARSLISLGVPAVARTALAVQAFTHGRTLGLQFHPEVTDAVLDTWLSCGGSAELAELGMDPQVLIEQARALADDAAARARELVRRFVSDVAPRPAQPLLTAASG